MAGARFFGGDTAGVPKMLLAGLEEALREADGLGEGVRLLLLLARSRCEEMRADFLGEKGSQWSL